MNEKHNYAPSVSVKEKDGKFGKFLSVGIKVEPFIEWMNANTNSRGYVNLIISPRREVGQYGDTHSVYLDTWEPKPQGQEMRRDNPAPQTAAVAAMEDEDSVPF